MGIIIEQFMCGYLLKVVNNFFFSRNELIPRIHGQDNGISLVPVMYLQGILLSSLPGESFKKSSQQSVTNNGTFFNNEFDDVYLVTTVAPIPLEAFTLQESEVSVVKYISVEEYKQALTIKDPQYVPNSIDGQYGQLFDIIAKRYQSNVEARCLDIQKKINRYAHITLSAEVVFSLSLSLILCILC
ncbi:putative Peptidase family M49 [Helianthus anomalus]